MGITDIAGAFTIKDNIFRPGIKAVNYSGTGANGIWVNQSGIFFDLPGGVGNYQPDWVRGTIENNDVTCEPNTFNNGARALGILAFRQVGTVIKNNIIRVDDGITCIGIDDGSDGFTVQGNVCSGSGLFEAIGVRGTAKNISINENDSSAATPLYNQVSIWSGGEDISVVNNKIGPPGLLGGIFCDSFDNHIISNTFYGDYLGWSTSVGFVLLGGLSSNNMVVSCKNGTPPHGFDICDQIIDIGTNNTVPGYESCAHEPSVINEVEARIAESEAEMEVFKAP
jgi:hypothetical protein